MPRDWTGATAPLIDYGLCVFFVVHRPKRYLWCSEHIQKVEKVGYAEPSQRACASSPMPRGQHAAANATPVDAGPSDGWTDARACSVAQELLDDTALSRAVAHRASRAAEHALFTRLAAGAPMVLGVFGASVAQNAGCLDQGARRCMRYKGTRNIAMAWGSPGVRKFKGWAVRLLDHVNASYPHAHHRINNSGLDAIPAPVAVECLFSYLPSALDVVVLEFGSMAQWNALSRWSIEATVRQFAALPSPPVILILSVYNWCSGVEGLTGGKSLKQSWNVVDKEALRVCEAYGAACISQKLGLLPLVQAGRLNKSDIVRSSGGGKDCLHPINAPLGVDLISTMLTRGWFDEAKRHFEKARSSSLWGQTQHDEAPSVLPSPLWSRNRNSSLARCYAFTTSDARWIRDVGLRIRPIRWWTSWCPADVTERAAANVTPAEESTETVCEAGPREANDTRLYCPRTLDQPEVYARMMASPPRHFIYCHVALAPGAQKQSFGVVALVPGATLRFGTMPFGEAGGGADVHRHLTASLTYLTSYEGMGAAALRCERCHCVPREIDAHRPDTNASVFVTERFGVVDAHRTGCHVVLHVLRKTSSGSHKFKVRFVTFSAAEA